MENPQDVLLRLPPFSYACGRCRRVLVRRSIVNIHIGLLLALYAILFSMAYIEKAVRIDNGIGIVENPPFFIHLLCGVCSIPIVLILAKRVISIPESHDEDAVPTFLSLIRKSKAKNAIWSVTFLIGLLSLAYTVSLSAYYKYYSINIYDSVAYPLTFAAYFLIRTYLYLVCYPFVFAAAPAITFSLFRALNKSSVSFRPFHHDEMGGLRKYFLAVDRPIYAVQSFAVLIALMNYIGWGGFEIVPLLLAIGAPIIVTLLAIFLVVHFRGVLAYKRQKEIQALCQQQMEFYSATRSMVSLGSKDCLELLEKIEATERILEIMKRSKRGGFGKYLINIGVLITPHLIKPIGEMLATKLLGSAP